MSGSEEQRHLQGEQSLTDLRQLGRVLTGSPPHSDADWGRLAELARREGVSAFLFWRVGQGTGGVSFREDVPPGVIDELREDLYTTVARTALAEVQLAVVLGALTRARIPVVVVKGAALGAYYPDPGLRPYGDIDIMVRREQLDLAEQALLALGYRGIASKDWWLDRFHHLPPMASEGSALLVELHWRLDYEEEKGRLPAEDLWARAMPWMVRGQPGLQLDPIDATLYLCRHAVVQHRVHAAFRALFDLAQVTGSWGGVEWQELAERALRYRLERPVYLMLVLAGDLLNLAVPADILSLLSPSGTAAEPGQLLQMLLGSEGDRADRVSVGAVQSLTMGSLLARLRFLIRRLFLSRAGMAAVYHIPEDSPRIWLAYLWRPVDLVGRYGRTALRALRGERGSRAAWQREVWLERWLQGEVGE